MSYEKPVLPGHLLYRWISLPYSLTDQESYHNSNTTLGKVSRNLGNGCSKALHEDSFQEVVATGNTYHADNGCKYSTDPD